MDSIFEALPDFRMLSNQANFDYMLQVQVKLVVQTGQAAYFDGVLVEEM